MNSFEAVAKWVGLILGVLGVLSVLARVLGFVRTEARTEAKTEAANAAAIAELKTSLLHAIERMEAAASSERRHLEYRLKQVEIRLEGLVKTEADRTSQILAVDDHARRLEVCEGDLRDLAQRVAGLESHKC